MLQIADYTVQKRLDSEGDAQVHAAVRRSDGLRVILKCYPGDEAADPGSRARRERDALRAAEGPGAPRVLELVSDVEPPCLVLEQVPGISVTSWVRTAPLAPEAFLTMAIQLADVLVRVHAADRVHCRVTPESIRVDPQSGRTCLVDFGLARILGATERMLDRSLHSVPSLLAYVAPEQTGRMARGMDARSDLYSLGAVFYFALTGRPPFESDDPLALVHAHMARTPRPPLEIRPDLPPTLSRIVLKLLQKEPSDRYQTAHALGRDLIECQEQLERTGRIADELPLGTADLPVRPMFSARLYGRDAESRALHEAYARATRDAVELVLLTGPPGVGKSALVQQLRTALSETGGYLAQGKFDLYRRDVPYSGLIAALESLTHQILRESESRVNLWRTSLSEALGKLARVVIELVPDLGILLPEAPPVPKLGPRETQARLVYALKRLVLGCGRPEHPLVLFIDDLQWADPGSRSVLEALLAQARGASLLVVTTCRNEDEPSWRPIAGLAEELGRRGVRVTQMEIEPLGADAAAEMLSDALARPVEEVRGLADRVAAKTGSNPLWIQQFLLHVHDLGLIGYAPPSGWTWDEAAIEAADVPEGAIGLLVAKLERLPDRPRAVIQLASCVGDEFEVELLCELTGDPRDSLEPPLFALAKEGLLAPSARGFRFAHDRIREAAQALLSEEERSRLHHRTGVHLLERAPLAVFTDRVFEIADHFNRSLVHLSEAERRKALEINITAGSRALAAGASHTAGHYLSVGRTLLEERDWESGVDLPFRLLFQSADAAYQSHDVELASTLLDALEKRPLARMQQASVAAKRIACLIVARPEEAFSYTLEQLRRFGIRVPARPSFLRARIAVDYTNWLMRGPLDESSFGRRPTQDPSWAAPILITAAGGAALLRRGGAFLLFLTTSRSLRRFRRYGAPPGITLTLAAFAAMLSAIRVRLPARDVERYVAATFAWAERMPSPLDVRARFSLHAFTLPHLRPRRSLIEPLQQIAEAALEVGDPEYATYTAAHRAATLALCGEELSAVVDEFHRIRESASMGIARDTLAACAEAYEVLRDPHATERDWSCDPPAIAVQLAHPAGGDASVMFHWFMILCYFGQYDRASTLLPRLTLHSFSTNPSSGVDSVLFRSICRAGTAARAGRLTRHASALLMLAYLQGARGRILPGSDFGHVVLGVRAEGARLRSRTARALELYQRAAQSALEQGYRHRAALLHERRASLLGEVRRDMERRSALRQAIDLYREWGAAGKVRQLERALRS